MTEFCHCEAQINLSLKYSIDIILLLWGMEMISYLANDNSIIFSNQGIIHFGKLSESKYNLIIINPFEYDNLKIFGDICNKINDIYAGNLIDNEKLILRLSCPDFEMINKFQKLFEILNKYGFEQIEFISSSIKYNILLENMLKEQKASLCIKLIYGKKLDNLSLKNLKTYLEKAKNKKDINVHCVIKDIESINDKELQNFITSMYKIGISKIGLRLDEKYLDRNIKITFPDKINVVLNNFFNTASKYSFYLDERNKEQNIFIKKLCEIKQPKKLTIKEKIKRKLLKCGDNYEI